MRSLVVKTIAFLAIAHLLPGFHVHGLGTALFMAIVYGFASSLAGLAIGATLIAALVTLVAASPPLAFLALLTTPLILFFVDFFIVWCGLILTSQVVSGFSMDGSGTALKAAVILGIVSALLGGKASSSASESAR